VAFTRAELPGDELPDVPFADGESIEPRLGTKTSSCGSLCNSAVHSSPETALIFPAAIFTAHGYRAEKLIQSASL
jgi:hypothetical protein